MQLAGEQLVKEYRSMRTMREFEERVHKKFATGRIRGFVRPNAGRHRAHGHSIDEGEGS